VAASASNPVRRRKKEEEKKTTTSPKRKRWHDLVAGKGRRHQLGGGVTGVDFREGRLEELTKGLGRAGELDQGSSAMMFWSLPNQNGKTATGGKGENLPRGRGEGGGEKEKARNSKPGPEMRVIREF